MRPTLILPDSVSSFHDYFRLTPDFDEVAKALGYSLDLSRPILPYSTESQPWATELQADLSAILPRVRLNSENARREFLISPILLAIARRYEVQLRTEMPINVSERLRGSLDYYMQSASQFLIVEAKNDDLVRGFSQLVAEMAAMDAWTNADLPTLYGAISTGTIWQFAVLHRAEKRFIQDLIFYRVPDEIPDLCAILTGILQLSAT